MKKIYYIYCMIPENLYNNKIKYLLSNYHDFRWKDEKLFGLYAWSTKKKIVKEFFEVREKSIYKLVKSDIEDKDELNRLKSQLSDLELGYRRYYYDRNENEEDSIVIVSTKNEHTNSTYNIEENLYEFGPKASGDFPYEIFKKKIIMALDVLGYTTKYDIEYGTEADSEAAVYNLSGFNLTKYGHNYKLRCENQMNSLLYLYRYFFYGNDRNISQGDRI